MGTGLLDLDQVALFTRRSRHSARELYRLRKIRPVTVRGPRGALLFDWTELAPYIKPERP